MPTVQTYSLPPGKYVQAVEYAHARHLLHFGSFLIAALVLIAILRLKIVPRLRTAFGLRPIWIVTLLLLLTDLFDLPAEVYAHAMSLRYHISIQGWPGWLWDWTKGELVSAALAVITVLPFFWLLRKSPACWWWHAWLISIPLMLFSAFADPLILEPLFNDFSPLAEKHPELIDPIEKMLSRSGVRIPREQLFEMEASRKTNALNAYVSGFGPSRRVVLYDTIIRKEPEAALLTTIGHELGHYALNHILQGLAFGSAGTLLALYVLSVGVRWFIRAWGTNFEITGVSDWASLPLFGLILLVFSFLAEPIGGAFSRWLEHRADIYSLEITHGLIPDAGQAAAQAFQIEGETHLEEPSPHPFIVFWLYSHPPVAERLRFSLEYDPWGKGAAPMFVK